MTGRRVVPLVVTVGGVLAVLSVPAPASASCARPPLRVLSAPGAVADSARQQPTRVPVRAGTRVAVVGRYFKDTCHDSAASSGCSRPPPPPPDVPSRDVDLVLVQGGRRWVLGTADAAGSSSDFAVRWSVRLPAALHAGTAHLVAGTTDVQLRVAPAAGSSSAGSRGEGRGQHGWVVPSS